jgi:rod shape-determining protein MreC
MIEKRYRWVISILISFCLICTDIYYSSTIKSIALEIQYPILSLRDKIFDRSFYVLKFCKNLFINTSLVQGLIEENEKLRQFKSEVVRLNAEVDDMKIALKYPNYQKKDFTSAKVIYKHSDYMIIDCGKGHGIKVGSIVVAGSGLVGKVIEVSENASRIAYIGNAKLKIPISISKKNVKGVISCTKDTGIELLYAFNKDNIAVGDILVTSGDGFPVGIPVARVVSIKNGSIYAKPCEDRENIKIVRLMDSNQSVSMLFE